ncbi:MAG: peptidoglycan-binding protein [Clostridia bacterium]|nr:peptidoglycan-binding protein [Clostridia bacterium]
MKKIISFLTILCLIFSITAQAATLKKGSRGSEVKTLQQNLNALYNYGLDADGIFGNATKYAVIDFQNRNGLEADGIVGNMTKSKINELLNQKNASSSSSSTMKKNSRGENVKDLQIKLNQLGYDIDADGIFGSATRSAVRKFQRANGLTVDGIVGSETMNAINNALTTNTTSNTSSILDENISKVSIYSQQGVSSCCKAVSLAQLVNLISGYDKVSNFKFWNGKICTNYGNYRSIVGSDGNTYKLTYKQDTYKGSSSAQKSKIENLLKNGLPIVVFGTASTGGQHWVTVIGKSGNDYKIIDPYDGAITTMSEKRFKLGYKNRYGYVYYSR